MIEVDPLFVGPEFKTEVWASERVTDAMAENALRDRKKNEFYSKLKRWATHGFGRYTGKVGTPVKHEGQHVFRVGDTNLFRIIGFYRLPDHVEFISLDAFKKNGQKLTAAQKARVGKVARIRNEGKWKKAAG